MTALTRAKPCCRRYWHAECVCAIACHCGCRDCACTWWWTEVARHDAAASGRPYLLGVGFVVL
jgi:hypothetical protein